MSFFTTILTVRRPPLSAAFCLLLLCSAVLITAQEKTGGVLTTKIYQIGEKGPSEGIVFYDKGSFSDGWRYMEIASKDVSYNAGWFNARSVAAVTSPSIGSGKANTRAIVKILGPGQYAAALCDDLVLGGYDDWFLPSKDELNLVFMNLARTGQYIFKGSRYWSSSQLESNSDRTWIQYFDSDGMFFYGDKKVTCFVRPVRSF